MKENLKALVIFVVLMGGVYCCGQAVGGDDPYYVQDVGKDFSGESIPKGVLMNEGFLNGREMKKLEEYAGAVGKLAGYCEGKKEDPERGAVLFACCDGRYPDKDRLNCDIDLELQVEANMRFLEGFFSKLERSPNEVANRVGVRLKEMLEASREEGREEFERAEKPIEVNGPCVNLRIIRWEKFNEVKEFIYGRNFDGKEICECPENLYRECVCYID